MTSTWGRYLEVAAAAAHEALPHYDDNPKVGCVIVVDDVVVAVGAHRGAGTPHAEIAALAMAGSAARGATVVITLEPCDHIGRTGSCTDALIAAGVKHVVFAHRDPTGHAMTGEAKLKTAGIAVTGPVAPELGAAVLGTWLTARQAGRPHTIWKVATTLDSRIADSQSRSKWITGEAARDDVQQLRASVGAIVTSTATVLADDPRLNVRGIGAPTQPLRVVVGIADIPPTAAVWGHDGLLRHERTRDIARVLSSLAESGVHRVLVESGRTLASAMLAQDLVDEIVWYHAGRIFGDGLSSVTSPVHAVLNDAPQWRARDVRIIGDDIRSTWHRTRASVPDSQTGV